MSRDSDMVHDRGQLPPEMRGKNAIILIYYCAMLKVPIYKQLPSSQRLGFSVQGISMDYDKVVHGIRLSEQDLAFPGVFLHTET